MKRLLMASLLFLTMSSAALAEDPKADQQPGGTPPVSPPEGTPDSGYPGDEGIPDVADLSPGDRAPDFKLDGSRGTPLQLSDLKGHVSVLLFDTDCTLFGAFSAVSDSMTALGVRHYGVCPNAKRAMLSYAEREKLPFPLLSDPNAGVSRRFGMYDDENQTIQPGLVIVDEKGLIRMVVQGPALHPDDVLVLVRHVIRGS